MPVLTAAARLAGVRPERATIAGSVPFVRSARAAVCAAVAVLLAGCAVPVPGPNAGAQAAAGSAPPPTNVTTGQEVGAVTDNKVQVTFPSGGSTLTPAANHQLDLAARLFRDVNPVLMFTTGYSDRSGDEFSNLVLSARRAEAVKRGLVARGIPPNRLLIQALGSSEPANATEPLNLENRRVVITWRLL